MRTRGDLFSAHSLPFLGGGRVRASVVYVSVGCCMSLGGPQVPCEKNLYDLGVGQIFLGTITAMHIVILIFIVFTISNMFIAIHNNT